MSRLDLMDRRRRQRTLRMTLLELAPLVGAVDGIRRLRQVDDQRWDEAQQADDLLEGMNVPQSAPPI